MNGTSPPPVDFTLPEEMRALVEAAMPNLPERVRCCLAHAARELLERGFSAVAPNPAPGDARLVSTLTVRELGAALGHEDLVEARKRRDAIVESEQAKLRLCEAAIADLKGVRAFGPLARVKTATELAHVAETLRCALVSASAPITLVLFGAWVGEGGEYLKATELATKGAN